MASSVRPVCSNARALLKLVLVPLALATAALAAHQSAAQLPPGSRAFVIDLDTTGGFTGRGRGGVTVDSDGRVRAARIGGANRDASECRSQLPAEELESLRVAVSAAAEQPWPESFAPAGDDGCCDRHRWTLRVEQRHTDDRVRTSATMWYDGNDDRLPKEVAVIRDVAMRALTRALADCGR
jgi:hypothetical protein